MPASQLPVGFLIADAHRLMRRRFEREAVTAGLGLTAGEARTLAYAGAYPGLRQAALAETMSTDPMTLVAHLDALEAKGLVAREVDPGDRRAKLVRPTETSGETGAAVAAVGATVRAVATRGLSDAEVAELRRMLSKLLENLSEAEADDRRNQG